MNGVGTPKGTLAATWKFARGGSLFWHCQPPNIYNATPFRHIIENGIGLRDVAKGCMGAATLMDLIGYHKRHIKRLKELCFAVGTEFNRRLKAGEPTTVYPMYVDIYVHWMIDE